MKSLKIIGILLLSCTLLGCQHQDKTGPHTISVGTIAGPETSLMQTAAKVALKKYGLHVHIVTFSDYTTPNIALNDGSIDANMFQHKPFLDAMIKQRHFNLVPVGKTFIYPMGIYSKKIKSIKALKKGDSVAIPNDPSNEARALILLEQAKLIKLNPSHNVNDTTANIVKNPLHLQFKELDAATLPRALSDVTIAAINTNYAIPAGLMPNRDALLIENKHSPYANIVVVKNGHQHEKKVKELVLALHSQAVLNEAKILFKGQAIQAW